MKFIFENRKKVTFVSFNLEKLDALQAPEFKSEILLQNKSGMRNLALDLTTTRYIDFLGLSAILVAIQLCRDSNGSFVLTGLKDAVKKLTTIPHLESELKITPTVNEAVGLVYTEEVDREL